MKKQFFKKGILIIIALTFFSFFASCERNEKDKEEAITVPVDIFFSDDDYLYMENTVDFIEILTALKRQGFQFVDNVATVKQYETATDKNKMLMRLGMLATDIAYLKIIGNKVQTPEYDKLFKKYLNELNLNSKMITDYTKYFEILSSNKLTDSLIHSFKENLRQDRKKMIQNAKNVNEDFLVYFSIGTEVELMHLILPISEKDKSFLQLKSYNEYGFENGNPIAEIFFRISSKDYTNPKYKEYKQYAEMLKPAYELMYKKTNNSESYSIEEAKFVKTTFNNLREEILK